MCRMLALTKKFPNNQRKETLTQFGLLAKTGLSPRGISSGHRDGWGIISHTDGIITQSSKHKTDASKDPLYTQAIEKIYHQKSDLILAHLRKSSVGKVILQNVHPFLCDHWSLCHNGHIHQSKKIPLSHKSVSQIQGTSDTERFFFFLLDLLREHLPTPKNNRTSILTAITHIQKHHPYIALNILLSNGKKLWVVREVNENSPEIQRQKALPYFALYAARDKQKKITALCSEKLIIPGSLWEPLPNHTLLELDLQTQAEKRYTLS